MKLLNSNSQLVNKKRNCWIYLRTQVGPCDRTPSADYREAAKCYELESPVVFRPWCDNWSRDRFLLERNELIKINHRLLYSVVIPRLNLLHIMNSLFPYIITLQNGRNYLTTCEFTILSLNLCIYFVTCYLIWFKFINHAVI